MAVEAHPHPAAGRITLAFSTASLAPRDATLFKSFVRLLDHRTHHKWVCATDTVDLHVVPEGVSAPRDAGAPATAVLTVGTSRRYLAHFLTLPIHADELETELNKLGALIAAGRPAPADQECAGGFRLVRWPPATLLGSPARVRLAAMMSAGPLTLQAAQLRAGLSAEDCSRFFEALGQAGLLCEDKGSSTYTVAPQPRPETTRLAQPGLIALIRNRLGLAGPRP